MTERDVFEHRLRAALLRHVADGPTEYDALAFARSVAAKEPRRHGLRGLATALTWRSLAIPRLAWVLLLLAALLAAVVAGMLVIGSRPTTPFPAVLPPIGQTYACPAGSTPDRAGPTDQVRPVVPRDAGAMAFDRRAGRLVALADGAAGIETWTFDVCTNTWTRMHPDQEPSSIGWWPIVYDVDSDVSILVAADRVWVYDLQDDTWTEMSAAPTGATPWAYDPRSGFVVAGGYNAPENLWEYDAETDMWTPIHQANPDGADPPYVVYDASVDRFLGFGGGTWLFDIRTGTWSSSGAAETPNVTAGFGWQAPRIAYDEAAERTVVFGNDRLALYDATADRWEVLDAVTGWPEPAVLSMTYDPVNERLIGCAWMWPDAEAGVFAFDLATREWTVLLEVP
jgi:hypothetical protein